jgi:DNA repair photolyase
MFPTTHDIAPSTLEPCLRVLERLLVAGNEVLIVTKPHLPCVRVICRDLDRHRARVEFRFTITSASDSQLAYWEPGAPDLAVRYAALAHARATGWRTSVSIEPCLDFFEVDNLIRLVEPHVSGTIWIGLLNRAQSRVQVVTAEDQEELDYVLSGQTRETVSALWERFKDNPKLRWKDSIRRMLGLPAATEPE